MPDPVDEVLIEEYGPQHHDAVVRLLAAAMGRADDPRFADLLEWKHGRNPFGVSPAWVALVDDQVVGYRAFLRWELQRGGRVLRMVRAVDTATDPAHQGKGIFRRLTLHGLEAMEADGVDAVFNTPNDQSRPGYLKMGWVLVGRVAPRVRPRSLAALLRMVRAKVPAGHWGVDTDVGATADEVFADDRDTEDLIDVVGSGDGMRTRLSPAYLRWRYDADLLGYRVLPLGDDVSDGVVCFRLRSRGTALEATIGDVLVPAGSDRARRSAIGAVLSTTRADYALVVDGGVGDVTVPLPGQGPTLVWRSVCSELQPEIGDLHLTMGDIELF